MVRSGQKAMPLAVQNAGDVIDNRNAVRVDLMRHVLKLLDTREVRLGKMIGQMDLMFSQDVNREAIRLLQDTVRFRRLGNVERNERRI